MNKVTAGYGGASVELLLTVPLLIHRCFYDLYCSFSFKSQKCFLDWHVRAGVWIYRLCVCFAFWYLLRPNNTSTKIQTQQLSTVQRRIPSLQVFSKVLRGPSEATSVCQHECRYACMCAVCRW